MNKFIKMQELRRRRRANNEEEGISSSDSINKIEAPLESPMIKKSKKKKSAVPREYNRDIAMATLKGKKNKPKRGRPRKIKESNTLFIDEWHDTCEFLPEDGEDIWFIYDEKIRVGFYEPQQQIFCMADGLGADIRDVRQWKYVGANKQIAIYPKERQIVAVSVKDFPCLATGIFTDHCVDPDTYKEKSGIVLDSDYEFKDRVVDFKDVNYWFELTEAPLVVLDPVEDSVLAVFPDEQEVIADKTGVVLDTPPEVEEQFATETPYTPEPASDGVTPLGTSIDFEKTENTPVTSDIGEADTTMEDMTDKGIKSAIANYTKKEESKEMVKDKLTEEQLDAYRLTLANEKVKDWYCATYPSDDMGEEIDDSITFEDVFDCLDSHSDIYDCLGVYDSIVRERVFEKLAEIMDVEYDYIYDQWMEESKCMPKDKKVMKESKKVRKLKEDNYGWSIKFNMVWDALEELVSCYGAEEILDALAKAMGDDDLKDNLEYICRNYDFEGDFLEGHDDEEDEEEEDDFYEDDETEDVDIDEEEEDYDEGFHESTRDKAKKLRESTNLKKYHLEALPKGLRTDLVNYLYDMKN